VRRVGLTGGIGSGKSTVAAVLRELDVPVLDLDGLSRAALTEDDEAIVETVRRFGPGITAADGTIDRRALGALVFRDPRAKADLERIVLARVRDGAAAWDGEQEAAGRDVVVHDSPLLLEQGHDRPGPGPTPADRPARYDAVIAVLARTEDRLDRLVASRDRTREHFRAVMANQVSDLERIRRATVLVLNTGDRDVLADRTRSAWARVLEALGGAPEGS
jgi:dephospho-CoA kinase